MPTQKQIVILISGRGSNMLALCRAAKAERWDVELRVLADRPQAAGLALAQQEGIKTGFVAHSDWPNRQEFERALLKEIGAADLVLLAGFMRILSSEFVAALSGRLLNIHPSLLPAFTGLHTHERALASSAWVHGASVHFVTKELDGGPIICQSGVPVRADDSPQSLAERVLRTEHLLYPLAVRWFLQGRLRVVNGRVALLGNEESRFLWFPDI